MNRTRASSVPRLVQSPRHSCPTMLNAVPNVSTGGAARPSVVAVHAAFMVIFGERNVTGVHGRGAGCSARSAADG